MTTSNSPKSVLHEQALTIALAMKQRMTMRECASKNEFKFGVVQDDKVLTIEMNRASVVNTSVKDLTEMVLALLQGKTS